MLTQKKLLTIKNAISVFDLLDQEKQPKVIFTTQRDNRVDDKICLQLAGIAFEIDDPLRPIIPDDTHPKLSLLLCGRTNRSSSYRYFKQARY